MGAKVAKGPIDKAAGTKRPVEDETGEGPFSTTTASTRRRDKIGEDMIDQTKEQKRGFKFRV